MRTRVLLVAVVVLVGGAGCTHTSLARQTVLTTTTVMDIQHSSVLANLALFTAHPEALPNHVHLADGVVQVNDRAGFGQAGGFTTFGGEYLGIDRYGPNAQRQLTEQWGTDATTDPERLYDLQSLYRRALGLEPLPPPNGIAYLRRDKSEKEGKTGSTPPPRSDGFGVARTAATLSGPASPGGGGSTPSPGGTSAEGSGRRVPIDVLLTDVPPPGWFHLGAKKDLPKDACYVGQWGERYCWVMPDGVPQLSRLTIAALAVIKLKPGERTGGGHGIAVTGGN